MGLSFSGCLWFWLKLHQWPGNKRLLGKTLISRASQLPCRPCVSFVSGCCYPGFFCSDLSICYVPAQAHIKLFLLEYLSKDSCLPELSQHCSSDTYKIPDKAEDCALKSLTVFIKAFQVSRIQSFFFFAKFRIWSQWRITNYHSSAKSYLLGSGSWYEWN